MAIYNPAGTNTAKLVSSLNINKREVYKELFNRDPELQNFFNFMRDLGAMEPVAQDSFDHYEKRSIFDGVKVGPGGSTVNGDGSLTFTADPSSVSPSGAVYPVVGNLVEFGTAGGSQQGRVSAINGATITIQPYVRDGSNALVAFTAVPAGTNAMVFSTAWGEGTGQPGGRTQVPDLYKGYTQIFKNSYIVTGSAETTEAWFEYEGQRCYSLVGEQDEAQRHLAEIDLGLLFNKGGYTANGEQMTKGLLQHARDRGINRTGGITAITDIDALCRVLTKLRAPKEYLLFKGIDAEVAQNQLFRDAKYYEGINYTQMGSQQNAVSLGFQSYLVNGFSFHSSSMNAFNHNGMAAQDGFNYVATTLGMPLAKVKDPKTGKDSFIVKIRNKQFQGINRWHKTWEDGANAATPIGPDDVRRVYWSTECGLETMGDELLYLNVGTPAA